MSGFGKVLLNNIGEWMLDFYHRMILIPFEYSLIYACKYILVYWKGINNVVEAVHHNHRWHTDIYQHSPNIIHIYDALICVHHVCCMLLIIHNDGWDSDMWYICILCVPIFIIMIYRRLYI